MDYYSMENRGGSVGSKGYNFQDLCAIKYFFEYIENEEFENLTVEQINDFTIRKGQILRSTPNTAPLICGACNTQPEGLLTMA